MYEEYAKIRDLKGLSDYAVAKGAHLGRSTISDWKNGTHTPNLENMTKIAAFLGVSVEMLTTGKDKEKISSDGTSWYFSDETARLAQELHDKPHLRALCDAERNLSPESAQALTAFIETQLKRERGDGYAE